jgi:predicted TIM-barrel fold metal-dependent hydrolase
MEERGTAEQLIDTLDAHGIDRGVLVQASVYGTDNSAILSVAQKHPDRFVAIVMANKHTLDDVDVRHCVAGVRLNLTDYAGHGDVDKSRSLADSVLRRGLILQVQAFPKTLDALIADLPGGPVVIDHLGRVDVSDAADLAQLTRLAERPDCYLKASGAFRLAGQHDWRKPDAAIFDLLAAFGPDRLLWGSDWPFIKMARARPHYADCIAWGRDVLDMDRAAATARKLFGWSND